MFDFLLSKEEKNRRLYLTNYKIAFDFLPDLCKKVCEEHAPIQILYSSESWEKGLKASLQNNYFGGKLPRIFHDIKSNEMGEFYVVGLGYSAVGMMSEPICSMIIIDKECKDYRIFCLERFMGERYYLCGVDKDLHSNYGIQYDGLKPDEFIETAMKMGMEQLSENVEDVQSGSEEKHTEDGDKREILATDNMYEYVINSGINILNDFQPIEGDSRTIAAYLCGSLIWEKGGSREEPNINWHIFRTMFIYYDLWKKFEFDDANSKAEQLLELFLKINQDINLVYQCIYEHKLSEDINTWNDLKRKTDVPAKFELVFKACQDGLREALQTIGFLKDAGVIYDPKIEGSKWADNFFYAQKDKIKKIAILVGLAQGGVLEDNWIEKSSEELVMKAGFKPVAEGDENGIIHLVTTKLSNITDNALHEKYQEYSLDIRRNFANKYSEMVHNSVFRDNVYMMFPEKEMCGWAIWCLDDTISGTKESILKIAESGNYEAYNNLAIKCDDEEEMLRYFRLAANNGSANAQQNLWANYYNEKNYNEANKWLKLAADGGNVYAMYNMAVCCYWGINMPKDLKSAYLYYRKLAVLNWNSPEWKYYERLIINANLSYWVVKEECKEQHIDVSYLGDNAKIDHNESPSEGIPEDKNSIAVSWSLIEFCKKYGSPRYVNDFQSEDGSSFAALAFDAKNFEDSEVRWYIDKDGEPCKSSFVMVEFSPLLPNIEMNYIIGHKKELQIVKIPPCGKSQYPSFELRHISSIEAEPQTDNPNKITLEDFELPNGGVYTGEAIRNFGLVEISGQGTVVNKDASKYTGNWFGGRPFGYGIYIFKNGDFHKGFFDDTPNGVGYLCLNSTNAMKIGLFKDGVMTGWAIGIMPGGRFNCSFLENGKVVEDHTDDVEWMNNFLHDRVFAAYKGNMVQVSSKNGYIRYGAPNRSGKNGPIEFERCAIGFTLTNDGKMYVGMVKDVNNLNGKLIMCTPDHKIICGTWKNNVLVKEESIKEVDAYTDIQFTFEKTKPLNIEEEKDDLPF